MDGEERCNTTLGLGIGVGIEQEREFKKNKRALWLGLSLPLNPKIEASAHGGRDHNSDDERDDQESFGSRTIDDHEEEEERRMKRNDCSNVDVYNNNVGSRKKLKLTSEQITLLEDSFKIHNTLNTGQKQELAKKLDLLPRQIEVWFQNRRARTKLKQIEQECELLRKCCESLSDENHRLKKELQEVRCCPLKFDHHHPPPQPLLPFYIQYPTAATMRRPCDKFVKTCEDKKTVASVTGDVVVHMHDNSNKKNATATLP